MPQFATLIRLSLPLAVMLFSPASAQEVIGSCEKDGFEIRLSIIDTPIDGSNASEATPMAKSADGKFQLTYIRPGPMREDSQCTRLKWRSQGGCIKSDAVLMLPKMMNEQVDTCSNYNEIVDSIKDMMVRNLRDRNAAFRQSLGKCVPARENSARVARAQANALSGDPDKNQSLERQINGLLSLAATKVETCIPNVTINEYGSRAYYQYDDTAQKMCAPEVDPQMLGVSVYAPADPLMNEVRISIAGGDGVMISSQTNVFTTIPGTVGSILGYAMCEPQDAPSYASLHQFTFIASEPVRWNGSTPQRVHTTNLERKCFRTTC